ncbi:MAG: histidinol-phosphatase HisJ family protein [Defluviitaleaceae bacterium]|nr:histidinol-phosphatase HisJ family protein [Defluviitaleaceae bacterium]
MYFDSHVHSEASPDSELRPTEAIIAAKNRGLGITFTEHVDYSCHDSINPNATDAPRGIGDFVCDFEKYPNMYKKLRGEGVMLGLEFGLTEAFLDVNSKLAEGDYDFILGSIHTVDGVELYQASHGKLQNEPYAVQLIGDDTDLIKASIRRYLIYANEMVNLCRFFDSFGHIDYIARYAPKVAEHFFYENFPNEFDALLKTIAERELALEINTSRFCEPYNFEKIMLKICRRFYELGGRLCTIGSDAHEVKNIGKSIEIAKELASEAELSAVYFKERKPFPCE